MPSEYGWWTDLTAAELAELPLKKMQELANDPVWQALQRERAAAHAASMDRLREQCTPLYEALAAVGFVGDLNDLARFVRSNAAAVPIILEQLQKGYSPRILEPMVRSLAVKSAKPLAWRRLRDFLHSEVAATHAQTLQFAVAHVLATLAEVSDFDALAEMAEDRSLGLSRVAFYDRLWKLKHPRAREIIEAATHEPGVQHEAKAVLRRMLKSKRPPATQ